MYRSVLAFGISLLFVNSSPAFIPGVDSDLLRGDANNDLRVDMSDPVFISSYLFQGGYAPPCRKSADANDDGMVDNSDVVYLYSYLFRGGPCPPEPFPLCGKDPTQDGLDCLDSSCR